jgi:DNA-directed RNA polymerase specialized sigma24 family protein
MSEEAIVDAITDLTRVMIALQGKYSSKSEAIRSLHELSIPNGRIAAILAMPVGDVASAVAKAKKSIKKQGGGK